MTSSNDCKYKLIWNLHESTYELMENYDGNECTEISSLPHPLLVFKKSFIPEDVILSGYSYLNLYQNDYQSGLDTNLRRTITCDYQYDGNCDFISIKENELMTKGFEDLIYQSKTTIKNKRPRGLMIFAGYDEEVFYRFFEKYETTPITYLFRKGFFDELLKESLIYIVTTGLLTHNDIQVLTENKIGIIYCFSINERFSQVIPFDLIHNSGGKVFLGMCEPTDDLLNGFIVGYAVKLLFIYYRKKRVLSENDFLDMLYSWWKEVFLTKYPPDSLIYETTNKKLLNNPSLEKLIELGKPSKAKINVLVFSGNK